MTPSRMLLGDLVKRLRKRDKGGTLNFQIRKKAIEGAVT